MLRGRVHALVGEREVRGDAAHVDEGAAALPQVLGRHQGAEHRAPEVGLDQALVIGVADLAQLTVDRAPRHVHPGVEAAEGRHRAVGDRLDIRPVADIRHDVDRLAADALDLGLDARQGVAAARCQHHPGAALRCHAGRGEADARGCPGDHDDLLAERLVLHAVNPGNRTCAAGPVEAAAVACRAIHRVAWFVPWSNGGLGVAGGSASRGRPVGRLQGRNGASAAWRRRPSCLSSR